MDSQDHGHESPSAHESGATTFTPFLDHHRDFLGASTPKSPRNKVRTRANSPSPDPCNIMRGRHRPAPLDMDAVHAAYSSNTRRLVERWTNNVAQAAGEIGRASDGTETLGDARALPEGVAYASEDIGCAYDGTTHIPNAGDYISDVAHARHVIREPEGPNPIADISTTRPLRRRDEQLNLNDARKYGSVGSGPQGTQAARFPLITPAEVQHRQVNWDGSSSVYSSTVSPYSRAPTVSPLVIPKNRINILAGYTNWRDTTSPDMQNTGTPIMTPTTKSLPIRSKSVNQIDEPLEMLPATTYQPPATPAAVAVLRERDHQKQKELRPSALVKSATVHDLGSASMLVPPSATTEQFSPLTPWVLGFDQRKATKNLFGDNGWLQDASAEDKSEKTETNSSSKKSQTTKAGSFFQGIKKMAREIAEVTNTFKTGSSRTLSEKHHITVSLDPREQSLLYCELEFALSEALNTYLQSQFSGGRLDPNKLKAVSDKWYSKGRPRVLGFRYDLETQLELVALHVGEFRFYGQAGLINGSAAAAGLLAVMKGNARTMRVRHLAQPDAVVSKHVVDAQALLRLLGAGENVQAAVAECNKFYEVAVERKKNEAEAAERQSREA